MRLVTAAALGLALGALVGAAGWIEALSFVGFWMGGMWLLLVLLPVALYVAVKRQSSVAEVVLLGAGASGGLLPFALQEAEGLPAYEVWFPLLMGAGVAVCLGPLYVAARRRVWPGRE